MNYNLEIIKYELEKESIEWEIKKLERKIDDVDKAKRKLANNQAQLDAIRRKALNDVRSTKNVGGNLNVVKAFNVKATDVINGYKYQRAINVMEERREELTRKRRQFIDEISELERKINKTNKAIDKLKEEKKKGEK